MKIKTQLGKLADEVNLSGSIFTVDGTDYDLDNIQPLKKIGGTEKEPVYESPENQRVYKDQLGIEIVFLKIDGSPSEDNPDAKDRQTMFIGNKRKDTEGKEYICSNLMLLYDINNDKDISLDELKTIVDQWNSSDSVRRTYNINRKKEALKTMTLDEYYLIGKVV